MKRAGIKKEKEKKTDAGVRRWKRERKGERREKKHGDEKLRRKTWKRVGGGRQRKERKDTDGCCSEEGRHKKKEKRETHIKGQNTCSKRIPAAYASLSVFLLLLCHLP